MTDFIQLKGKMKRKKNTFINDSNNTIQCNIQPKEHRYCYKDVLAKKVMMKRLKSKKLCISVRNHFNSATPSFLGHK